MIEKNYDEKVNEALENANFHRATAIDLLVKMAQLPYLWRVFNVGTAAELYRKCRIESSY